MIPTSIDGTDITGATIDGTDVTEITVDGQTVFTAGLDIPDSGNLQRHYDARQISNISTFTDLEGNNDLASVGGPSLVGSGIDGQQSVLYDGVDDLHQDTNAPVVSPEFTIAFVVEFVSVDTSTVEEFIASENFSGTPGLVIRNQEGEWGVSGAGNISGGTVDTNKHAGVFVKASDNNDILEIDGAQVASGDSGVRQMDGLLEFGATTFANRFANILLGEVMVWSVGQDIATRSDIFDYFAAEWGTGT